MIEEKYDKLTMTEQEDFKRLINLLLAKTYILQRKFNSNDGLQKTNQDYIFIERNFDLFTEYLEIAGFRIQKDSNYGVISLSSYFDFNRQHFDKFTTFMLYVLRLIYEESRETVSLSKEVFTSTGELIHKMISLGTVKKKPSDKDIEDSLKKLGRFNIIEKIDGKWAEADTRFIILPTILFIVTNERLSNLYMLIETRDVENSVDENIDEINF